MFVVVVSGPPCSGKTTYVREHVQPGDVVVDYDAIAQAIGSDDPHDHHPALHGIILHACDAVLRRALRDNRIAGIWLIRSRPRRSDLALASEVVAMDTPLDECRRRAQVDGRSARCLELIEGWHTADGQSAAFIRHGRNAVRESENDGQGAGTQSQ